MSTLRLPGLFSGIDTNTLISQLMAIERQTLNTYQKRVSDWEDKKDALSDLEPIDIWHFDIEDDQGGMEFKAGFDAVFAPVSRMRFVSSLCEEFLQHISDILIVVNNQDEGILLCHLLAYC